MQLKTLKYYVSKVVKDGNEWQRKDINNKIVQRNFFTQTQFLSFCISCILTYCLNKGYSESFAGYVISFLSIFIGLFTTIIISLFDKSNTINEKIDIQLKLQEKNAEDNIELAWLYKSANYLKKFTSLTSYSIFLAIIVIFLLLFTLLFPDINFNTNRFKYFFNNIDWSVVTFTIKFILVEIYRFSIAYFLCNFFIITTYAVTSYFTYINKSYQKQFKKDD